MSTAIVVSIFMGILYSWEELKGFVLQTFSGSKVRHKKYLDKIVSDTVLVATIPLTICLYITSDASVGKKLFATALQLAFTFGLLKVAERFQDRVVALPYIDTVMASGSLLNSKNNLLATPFAMPSFDRYSFASKFILHLLGAALLGLLFLFSSATFSPQNIESAQALLTLIFVGCLIVWITILHLENFLNRSHVSMSALLRIFIGIVLSCVLLVVK